MWIQEVWYNTSGAGSDEKMRAVKRGGPVLLFDDDDDDDDPHWQY